MTVTNSDKNLVIIATSFLLKVTKRTSQQKVHSSAECFKKDDLNRFSRSSPLTGGIELFVSALGVMTETGERVLPWGSRNVYIQVFHLHVHFLLIWRPQIWIFFTTMVGYTALWEILVKFMEKWKPSGVCRNIRGCIL